MKSFKQSPNFIDQDTPEEKITKLESEIKKLKSIVELILERQECKFE